MKTKMRFFTKETEAQANEGISPNSILFAGAIPLGFTQEFMDKYGLSLKKIDRAFVASRFGPHIKEDLYVLIWVVPSRKIVLTEVEITSGTTRIEHAENLILQLPKEHEGRIAWLMNYGNSEEASEHRANWSSVNGGRELQYDYTREAYLK